MDTDFELIGELYSLPGGYAWLRGRGHFDSYCIFLLHPDYPDTVLGNLHMPLDTEYFTELYSYTEAMGTDRVWRDYLRVFGMVGFSLQNRHCERILELTEDYPDPIRAAATFITLYYTMWAEMWKDSKSGGELPLKKYIKLLGVKMLLFDKIKTGRDPKDPVRAHIKHVANVTRGKGADTCVRWMTRRGIRIKYYRRPAKTYDIWLEETKSLS